MNYLFIMSPFLFRPVSVWASRRPVHPPHVLASILLALAVTAPGLLARERSTGDSGRTTAKSKATAEKPVKTATVTGSLLRRPVNSEGLLVSPDASLYVIRREDIQRSGAGTVGELLRKSPGVH